MRNIVAYRPLAINYEVLPPFANTKSLLFTGVDDAVLIPPPSALNNTTEFTVSMWFKPTSLVGQRTSWSMGSSASQLWGVTTIGNVFYIYGNGGGNYLQINGSLVVDTWYSLVLVYDGSLVNADRYKVYLNGTLLTGGSVTGTIAAITPTFTTDFKISGLAYSTVTPYTGNVDEFSIFDRIVTPAEIVTLSTAPAVDITSLNPNNWYRNGDNGSWKSPQWLIPSNENKDKVSNYSMDFDGVNDYIDLGDSDDFSFGNGTTDSPFTISAWIKMDSTARFRIFNKYAGTISEYQFGTGGAGNLQFFIFDDTNAFIYRARTHSAILNTGQWYHVAATYSGVGGLNAQDGMKIYVDGIRVDDSTVSGGSYVAMGNKTTPVYIGKLDTTYANGLIDEVSIYDSELSQSQITDIYNGGEPATITGAIAHYKMGEEATFAGGVWTVPDAVGTNDGTSSGMLIDARVGDAPNSTNNALSFNMDFVDVVPDVPN
jgi:hypothetical protein